MKLHRQTSILKKGVRLSNSCFILLKAPMSSSMVQMKNKKMKLFLVGAKDNAYWGNYLVQKSIIEGISIVFLPQEYYIVT